MEIQNVENHLKESQSTNRVLLIGELVVKHKLKITISDGKTFGIIYANSGIFGTTMKMVNLP